MYRYGMFLAVIFFAACSSKESSPEVYRPQRFTSPVAFQEVEFSQINGWQEDSLVPAFKAFMKSIPKIKNKKTWKSVCEEALRIDPKSEAATRRFFEQHFQAFAVSDRQGNTTGTITGYYEPLLHGSRTKTDLYKYPVYTKPKDLVDVRLSSVYPGLKKYRLRGRLYKGAVIPYYTRQEIDGPQNPLKGNEIFWVESKINLYFLHVQGSGRIQLNTGEVVKVGYNDQNGYPYTSIGKLLVSLGEIPAEEISMQSIKEWFNMHPHRFEEICNVNDRYNFFMEMTEDQGGPLGSLNVPLTPERSVAVDRQFIELGTPLFLSTTYPDTKKKFQHLVMAQDTGAAIVGRIRADLFWGFGNTARQRAGIMKEQGRIWILLPHGVKPGREED